MCLSVKRGTNKRKAKADILVYKCLDCSKGSYCTPFQYFPIYFEDGKCVLKIKHFTYNSNIKKGTIYMVTEMIVSEGIHSFYEELKALKVVNDFHEKYRTDKHYAIIPKGANYYIGDSGDVVSTELIIFKTQKDYNKYVKTSEKICKINENSLSLQEI